MRFKNFFSVFFILYSFSVLAQSTTINCPNCKGGGTKSCVTCSGKGTVMWVGMYGPQWSTCGFCKGTGTAICVSCGGSGKVTLNTNIDNNGSSYNGSSNYDNSSNSSSSSSSSSSQHWCNVCKGTGSMIKSWYVSSNYETYCRICKQKFYHGHTHVTCTSCNGKGYW